MLEAEIKAENGLTEIEIGYYLTIATAMLPLGAIAGTRLNIKAVSSPSLSSVLARIS